ncbi:hypothetical protein AB3A53_004467 [Vibrio vulnificus]
MRLGKNLLLVSFSLSLAIGFSVSAIQYCRPKFLNHSGRKTCQSSWVASLGLGAGYGWFRWRKVWQEHVYRQFFFAGCSTR